MLLLILIYKILRGDNYIRQMYETEIKIKLANDLNRAENIEKGKEEGLKEGKIEIAKNMLKDNVDINVISKYSGLSIEEIELLKK